MKFHAAVAKALIDNGVGWMFDHGVNRNRMPAHR
jgi:hypothetical protein